MAVRDGFCYENIIGLVIEAEKNSKIYWKLPFDSII